MEGIKIESIIQDGDYFHVTFYDWSFLPFKLHIHKLHLKNYYEIQNCNESKSDLYGENVKKALFNQLISDVSCRDTRDLYLKDLAREMLADKQKVNRLNKQVERLSREYTELLKKFRELEIKPDLRESIKNIYSDHITNLIS